VNGDGDEFLQTSHPPAAQHRPLSLSKWLVRILRPVIKLAPGFLPISVADLLHRRAVGTEVIGDEDMRATMASHGFPQEFKGCRAITALCNEAFQDVPVVIYSNRTIDTAAYAA
jgi:hypothetical protein